MDFKDLAKIGSLTPRLAVIGSKNWPLKSFVIKTLDSYLQMYPEIDTFVLGGQEGVDLWASEYADEKGLNKIEVIPPHLLDPLDKNYRKYDSFHFFLRNQEIVDRSDRVLGFWYQNKAGSKDMTDRSKGGRKPYQMFTEKDLKS